MSSDTIGCLCPRCLGRGADPEVYADCGLCLGARVVGAEVASRAVRALRLPDLARLSERLLAERKRLAKIERDFSSLRALVAVVEASRWERDYLSARSRAARKVEA